MGHRKQEMGHWTWYIEDGTLPNNYECELMVSDYLPSISLEKFLWWVGGGAVRL